MLLYDRLHSPCWPSPPLKSDLVQRLRVICHILFFQVPDMGTWENKSETDPLEAPCRRHYRGMLICTVLYCMRSHYFNAHMCWITTVKIEELVKSDMRVSWANLISELVNNSVPLDTFNVVTNDLWHWGIRYQQIHLQYRSCGLYGHFISCQNCNVSYWCLVLTYYSIWHKNKSILTG